MFWQTSLFARSGKTAVTLNQLYIYIFFFIIWNLEFLKPVKLSLFYNLVHSVLRLGLWDTVEAGEEENTYSITMLLVQQSAVPGFAHVC